MQIKTASLIGLGALGIIFSQKLQRALGESFSVIADSNRTRRYQTEGVFSNGARCDFNFTAPGEGPAADLVIYAVKYGALPAAIQASASKVGNGTILLSAINGICSEEDLKTAFPQAHVLYCVAQGMDAVKTGNKLTYVHEGMLRFGEKDDSWSRQVKAVADLFDRAGIRYDVPENMKRALWSKFMLNVGLNQASMVYDASYGDLQRPGPARDAMIAAMEEVRAISAAEGIDLVEEDVAAWLDLVARFDPEGCPSMLQDRRAQRPSEVELFAGTAIRLGEKHGIATPVNEEFQHRIQELESKY